MGAIHQASQHGLPGKRRALLRLTAVSGDLFFRRQILFSGLDPSLPFPRFLDPGQYLTHPGCDLGPIASCHQILGDQL